MTARFLIVLAAGMAALAPLPAAAEDQPREHFVSREELSRQVAATSNGVAIYTAPTGEGLKLLMVRREQDGEAELHDHVADEFVAVHGVAEVIVGGTLTGHRQTAPGEWRGGVIEGGRSYRMTPGDILWIPAGIPHQTLVPQGEVFEYMAFKVEDPRP